MATVPTPSHPTGGAPLAAWFTIRGEFIGVSGVPVRLHPGQAIDPVAWYTADGHRAAVAGPFRDDVMNKQGYLRGGQILAAERMARQVARSGQTSSYEHLAAAPATTSASLGVLDWVSITNGGLGTAAQFKQWDLVDVGKDGIERWHSPKTGRWYPVKNQPNGITGPRGEILEEASRFGRLGKVCFVAGEVIAGYQLISAYTKKTKTDAEAQERRMKMGKAGLDMAMGVIGAFGGPIGFAIATVYFVVDTAVSISTNGQKNILDLPDILFGAHGASSNVFRSPQEMWLVAPADHTRAVVPMRRPLPSLAERLRHMPVTEHNAVFRSATY